MTTFGLSDPLLKGIQNAGYAKPTPIQEKIIPLVLNRHDVLAKAETGSGKSAGFVLPILELIGRTKGDGKPKIKALIMTPTRELAQQLTSVFDTLGAFMPKKPKVVCIIGGEKISEQLLDVQQGCDIVVATTGRLLDILEKRQINLSYLEFFVLDEADKMLDLGFSDELDALLKILPPNRQNLLLSATYPPKVLEIASKITTKAIKIEIESEMPTVESITQRAIEVNKENRSHLLRHLIEKDGWDRVLVFMANRRSTDNIAMKFRKHKIMAESFHGDLTQEERNYTLAQFKSKKTKVLFSTDIAARGLDISELACVVNFDLPRSPADYIHRIGRTGRAGKPGVAISFIGHEDKEHLALIEKRAGIRLQREQVVGFELTGNAPAKISSNEPIKGKRKSKKDKAREAAAKTSGN